MRPLILIVENDPVLRALLTDHFRDEGYRVVGAADGQEALDRVAVEAPGVILSAIVMPGVDGLTLVHRLRAAGQEIPVVLMSGARPLSCPLGVRFVPKPFRLEILAVIVANSLTAA